MNRFVLEHDIAADTQTGLMWPCDAALAEFSLTWNEAFEFIKGGDHTGVYLRHPVAVGWS